MRRPRALPARGWGVGGVHSSSQQADSHAPAREHAGAREQPLYSQEPEREPTRMSNNRKDDCETRQDYVTATTAREL